MIKHESHMITMSVNTTDAAPEGGDQIIHRTKQDIGQDRTFQMAPQSFDQVQVRTVRRQPEDAESFRVLRQKRLHRLRVMKAGIVAYQTNLTTGIRLQQNRQKGNKVPAAFGLSHRMDNATGRVIHAAINHLLGVLSGRGNFGLLAFSCPETIQGGQAMQLGFILEDQYFLRTVFRGVFFKRESFLRAFSQAASSRFPLRVCLGRRKEKPS